MVVFEDTVGNGPLFFSGQLREHFFEVQVVRDSKPSWVAENEMPLVREFELIEEREYASTGKDQRPTFESLYGTLPSYYGEERRRGARRRARLRLQRGALSVRLQAYAAEFFEVLMVGSLESPSDVDGLSGAAPDAAPAAALAAAPTLSFGAAAPAQPGRGLRPGRRGASRADLTALPVAAIGRLAELTTLHLGGCVNLTALPQTIGRLVALTTLNLRDCISLTALPQTIGRLAALTALDLRDSRSLTALPQTIGRLAALTTLNLRCCKSLTALPQTIGRLAALTALDLSCCESLTSLPGRAAPSSSVRAHERLFLKTPDDVFGHVLAFWRSDRDY
ncbi:hypothetical protein JL720_16729 [Aureococcus anophagefferens]|nr:hypothetical protein JL720_16729 [Aureococcus anophagefferens]